MWGAQRGLALECTPVRAHHSNSMAHCGIQGGVGKDVKTTKPTSFVNNGGTFSNYD